MTVAGGSSTQQIFFVFGHEFFVLFVGSDRVQIAGRPGSLVERGFFDEEGEGVHFGVRRGHAGTPRARRIPAWNAAPATGGALAGGVDRDDGRGGRLLMSQLTVALLSADLALVIVIVRRGDGGLPRHIREGKAFGIFAVAGSTADRVGLKEGHVHF